MGALIARAKSHVAARLGLLVLLECSCQPGQRAWEKRARGIQQQEEETKRCGFLHDGDWGNVKRFFSKTRLLKLQGDDIWLKLESKQSRKPPKKVSFTIAGVGSATSQRSQCFHCLVSQTIIFHLVC